MAQSTLQRFSSWPSARMEHAGSSSLLLQPVEGEEAGNGQRRRLQQRAIIERIPVEVLERIAELLPPSTRRRDCLNLIRVCKQW
jgi:hypothetical protein